MLDPAGEPSAPPLGSPGRGPDPQLGEGHRPGRLAGDKGLDVVRAGEEQARRLGVSGVPFFVVNGRVALSGAQPPELFRQAFEQAGAAVVAGEVCEIDPATGKKEC